MADTLGRTRVTTALSAIVTAIGVTALVRLFTEGPGRDTDVVTLADFEEPEGTWYDIEDEAFPTAAYGAPYVNDDGEYEVTGESVQFDFVEAEGNDPVQIKGYMVVKADGSEVYHWGYLPTPKDLGTNLDAVIVQPRIALPPVLQPIE